MKLSKLSLPLILTSFALLLRIGAKQGMPLKTTDPEKLKEKIPANHEGEPPANDGERPPVARSTIEIPDSILQEYRANQQQQRTDNKRNRWIAIAAVAGAWIYAGIAAFQAYQMIETERLE
jgi:hypothetical protein